MVAGQRFDLEAARAEARAAKKAARARSIVANAVLVLVLAGLVAAGWWGFTWWRDHAAQKAAEEQAARDAEERAQAERARVEAERRAAEQAKRDAERKAAEAKREAERKRREDEAKAKEAAREAERKAKEEAERLAKENEAWQKANEVNVRRAVTGLKFSVFDHLCTEAGADVYVDAAVDEPRWVELYVAASQKPLDFLDMLRGTTVTNAFSEVRYPDRETVQKLLANLAQERFTMIVRLKTEQLNGRRLTLVAADPREGLVLPQGARAMKAANGRVTGWTAPFVYGDPSPLFVMSPVTVDRFNREWRQLKAKLRKDAAKLSNVDEYVANRLAKDLPDFVRSVRIELQTPPPVEQPKAAEPKREPKIKSMGFKGTNSDMRSLKGPSRR